MLRKPWLVAGILLLALACLSCESRSDPERSDASILESQYLSELYEFRPTIAVRQGMRQYEGRSVSLTPLAVARRIDQLKQSLSRVITLRQRELAAEEAMLARLIDYRIRSELLDLETIQVWRHDPLEYLRVPFDFIVYLMDMPSGSPSDRLRSIVIHLHELEAMMANMRGNLREVPEARVLESLELGGRLRQVIENVLPEWGLAAAGVDVNLRDDFELALERAGRSLDMGLEWLGGNLPPAANGEAALGYETFVMKLLFDEMVAIPLEELRAQAEQRLEEDHAAFLEQARRMAPNQSARELLRSLGEGGASPGGTGGELQALVEEAREFGSERGFAQGLDGASIEVTEAPDYLRDPLSAVWLEIFTVYTTAELQDTEGAATPGSGAPAARLYFAPPAGNRDEELWEARLAELRRPALMLSAAREAIPGRYWMEFYARRAATVSQRILPSRSAVDGWGAYVEEVLLEEGYGAEDPAVSLLNSWRELLADCRLVAAIRLHTEGATLEEVAALFVEKALQTPVVARREARSALLDPSGSFGVLAKLEILDLRSQYRERKASAFDLGEFHAEYLSQGPIPVALARQRLLASD